VHKEEVEVAGVVDEEGLVAGGHHVAGLLVGSVANLQENSRSARLFHESLPMFILFAIALPPSTLILSHFFHCPCG
jgi:hypothetical protein